MNSYKRQILIGGGYKHYEVIDFLKGFSIATIALMHLIQGFIPQIPDVIKKMSALGGTGVHVFVFCSGFGLYLSYLKSPKSYTQFLSSRFKKLYIPYIVVVLIAFFIPFTYSGNYRLVALFSHVFLFKMFFESFEGSFGGQLWFMSTIIQFYLIFIPLCYVKKRINKSSYFVGGALLMSAVWWIIVVLTGMESVRVMNSFFLQYFWEFCLGMCIAEKFFNGYEIKLNKALLSVIAIIGISIQGVLALKGGALRVVNDIPALFGYGSLAILLYSTGVLNKFILFISKFSYEWYLVHVLIFTLICRFKVPTLLGQIGIATLAFVVSIAVAWIYSKIMKAFTNWRRKV